MSLWGAIHAAVMGVLSIAPETNRDIIATGNLDGPVSTHRLHMYRAQEFRALLERSGLIVEAMSADAVLSANWNDALRDVLKDNPTWQHLLEMELEACRESGCLDMGEHLIAVCGKGEPCDIS